MLFAALSSSEFPPVQVMGPVTSISPLPPAPVTVSMIIFALASKDVSPTLLNWPEAPTAVQVSGSPPVFVMPVVIPT